MPGPEFNPADGEPRDFWQEAFEHLQEVRKRYVEIGASGIFALTMVFNPLVVRYEQGERTQVLYEAMMSIE